MFYNIIVCKCYSFSYKLKILIEIFLIVKYKEWFFIFETYKL